MPYISTWDKKGNHIKFYGVVSAGEIESTNNEAHNDERFDDIKYFICDMTEITDVVVTESDAINSAATDKVHLI